MPISLTAAQKQQLPKILTQWATYTDDEKQKTVETLRALAYQDGWPIRFINRDTNRFYVPHNIAASLMVQSDIPKRCLVLGGEGSGKALDIETLLPTSSGWTTMGEVKIGDSLLDDVGRPCAVTHISPVMYNHKCYEVVFDDGHTVIADAEHVWITLDSKFRKAFDRGSIKTQYEPEQRTTEEIRRTLRNERGFINHAIPLARPLSLPDKDLLLDPYMLGVWLGDGTAASSRITIGDQDSEEMVSLIRATGHTIKRAAYDPITYGIDVGIGAIRGENGEWIRTNPNALIGKLRALDLIENKHIPQIYMRASYNQRLALLQGLMDTDGYINEEGRAEFCSAKENLALDAWELMTTLGIKSSCKFGTVRCNGKDCPRYRFAFMPHEPIFRLTRKASRVMPVGRHAARRYRRYIVDVREHGSVPVKCVQVDSYSHMYLAGRGMIPTHNTAMMTQKTLNRGKRGMDGILASPSMPHLRRSAWAEFIRWTKSSMFIPAHHKRLSTAWEPREPFRMVYNKNCLMEVAGIVRLDAIEGPNINYSWLDEGRHYANPEVIKTLEGRTRILGPRGEPSQEFFSTTPPPTMDHWLFTYFGPLQCKCPNCGDTELRPHYMYTEEQLATVKRVRPDTYALWANTGAVIIAADGTCRLGYEKTNQSLGRFRKKWMEPGVRLQSMSLVCPDCASEVTITDPYANFKMDSMVIALLTAENVAAGNVESTFVDDRGESLTEDEKGVLLWAEWGDVEQGQPFLPHISWWDKNRENLPPLTNRESMVLALDAATGRQATDSDCFAIVGVTRHPDRYRRDTDCAVRFVQMWQARAGQKIDFQGTPENPGPELVVRQLCDQYNIVMVTYDPTELHDMAQRFRKEAFVWMKEFSQSSLRYEADRQLLNMIQERRIAHSGDLVLRQHIQNADRKLDTSGKKLRIVKRSDRLRIDGAVGTSMSAYHTMRLNI